MTIIRARKRKLNNADKIEGEILLVEDQRSLAEMTAKMLYERWGCRVLIATSLRQVHAILAQNQHHFFVAVSDLNLPDATQGEVIDVLLAANIRVIAMTGMFDEELRDRILKKGVIDYVLKDSINSYEYIVELVGRLHRNMRTKVMVVDDTETFCSMMASMLRVQGLQVVTANDGLQALAMLEQHSDIKLVLLDYAMPNMDGFVFLMQVRRKLGKESLAVIGMAQSGNMSAQFLKLGANDFISKPFNYEELVCRVSQNLGMQESLEAIRYVAYHDYLTALMNRRAFFEQGEKLFDEAYEANRTMAAIIMDIDFFKKINDAYGHDAGDEVLKHFSELLRAHFKQNLVARIGGEEFAILLSDAASAAEQCESFRLLVSHSKVHSAEYTISYSVSIGLTCGRRSDLEMMLKHADEALYQAKAGGRNCVVVRESADPDDLADGTVHEQTTARAA